MQGIDKYHTIGPLDLDRVRDCNLDVPVYTGHSLFNTTKRIT